MPQLNVYELRFRAGLHIGRHGIGQEVALAYVPADTLFAALVAVRAQLRGDAGAWAERFVHAPPFRLTSAFPFAGGVRFFPRPVHPPASLSIEEPKRWRKIRFVSQGVLEYLLKGDVSADRWPKPTDKELAEGPTLQGGALWLTQAEVEKLPEELRTKAPKNGRREPLTTEALQRQKVWSEDKVPRVTVDRLSNASQIYHTGRIAFTPGCGLWFGVQSAEGHAPGDLEELLYALGDAGLGAERSTGYGAFTPARVGEPLQLPQARPGGLMMLLSRFYPRDENDAAALKKDGAAYDLVYVAGRVRAPGVADQRRRGVRLVMEGSLIGGEAVGRLAEVKPGVGDFPHEVYRYGLALGAGWGGG